MEITEFRKLTLLSGSLVNKLKAIVEKVDDPIAKELIKCHEIIEVCKLRDVVPKSGLVTDVARQITMKYGDTLVSYLPEGKDPVFTESGNWSTKNRQTCKPAKLFQKLLVKQFENKEYEQFCYALKGQFSNNYSFEVVKGDRIKECYDSSNYYSETGTLGNSCMRYCECQDYFDVYTTTPECSMLVAYRDEKVAGRAILWTIDDITYMDRVYYIEDCLFYMFLEYAENQGWWHLAQNTYVQNSETQHYTGPDSDYQLSVPLELSIHLSRIPECFPYMDSFRYLDLTNNTINTFFTGNVNSYLCNTEGTWENNVCQHCRGCCSEDDMYYSEVLDIYGCSECLCWSEYENSYILSESAVYYRDKNGYGDYIRPEALDVAEDIVNIDGRYYHVQSPEIKKSIITGKWSLK